MAYSCTRWQPIGLPRTHAAEVIGTIRNVNRVDYIDKYYYIDS